MSALLKEKERVRVLVRSNYINVDGIDVVHGDLLDAESIRKAAKGVDTIYHLAAAVDYAAQSKGSMYQVNVDGTRNLLENSGAKRFIYQSSTSVYGNRMGENPANERTPCNPSGLYGKTKLLAERLVLEANGIVLRSPVIYGPGFNEGFWFVLSSIKKGKMRIIGKGDNSIQWIHVDDLVQALLLSKDKAKPGNVYLVAGKESKTQAELFSLLAKELRVAPPQKRIPMFLANSMARYIAISSRLKGKSPRMLPEHISRITGSRLFDISKAERELGFKPMVSYAQGAREMAHEYLYRRRGNTKNA